MLKINKIETSTGTIFYCQNDKDETFFADFFKSTSIIQDIKLLKSDKRRIEKYVVHYILTSIYSVNYELVYKDSGKPILLDKNNHISISHSKNLIAIFISNTEHIGVDVEYISEKIIKIASKFISDDEQLLLTTTDDYTLIWSAKETIYKSYGISGVDFKQGMNVLHIDRSLNELKLKLHYKDLNTFCKLHYQIINGFTLVYHE